MPSQWNPIRDLLSLQERMNELFEESLGRSPQASTVPATWTPAVDIYETSTEIVLKADLPGLTQEQIEVNVEDRQLLIRGERRADTAVAPESYHRIERPTGSFRRVFNLPPSVDESGIRAEYRNGILTLSLPKRGEAKPRAVTIKVE